MKVMRKIIEIDEELCDGCGQCVPSCAEGAIELVDGKARLAAEKYCDGLGACLGECPNDALKITEREADDFDEEAVTVFLKEKETAAKAAPEPAMACGCPSSQIRVFAPEERHQDTVSNLSHWPVQINLIPPTAPFLKGADLLVVADCAPIAYPNLHADFMKGKTIMMGCPKFDDAAGYIEKFTEIFKKAGIRSITSLCMEVPCCSALPMIVKRALTAAGKEIPMEQVVIGTRGDIISRQAN